MKVKLVPVISLSVLFLLRCFSQDAFGDALPSAQLKPILGPCLNAILSPLETNPAMPRVQVETMRADFAASFVTGSTPAEKQVYRNAMAVCDAMTSDMDARAKAQAQAQTSAEMPTLSTGGDIIASMPMHGRNPGAEGQAIRKKQKQERKDADRRAQQQSAFANSSAYTSWVNNGPNLRDYVMGLYTRQVELEALYKKSMPAASPSPAATADAAKGPKDPSFGVGTWVHYGKPMLRLWLSQDNVASRLDSNNRMEVGTWTIDDQGHWKTQFPSGIMKGFISPDGKTLVRLNGLVYKLKE
jgi:hypothetical protein